MTRVTRSQAALVLALLGGFGMATQVLLLREYLVIAHGDEVSLGIFYSAWLAWIAAGAAGANRLNGSPESARDCLAKLLMALGALLPLEVVVLRCARGWLPASAAEVAPLGQIAGFALLGLAPVGLTIGAAFPTACRAMSAAARDVGRLFWAEAAGAIAGGVVVTVAVIPWLLPIQAIAVCCGLPLAGVLGLARFAGQSGHGGPPYSPGLRAGLTWRSRRDVTAWAVVGLIAVLAAAASGSHGQRWLDLLRWQALAPSMELVESLDSPHQNLAIGRRGDQLTLLASGKILESFPDRARAAEQAALLMTQHPGPRRLLLLGGAGAGLLREILQARGVESVEVLEVDPAIVKLSLRYWAEPDRTALLDPRVRLHFEDGRRFLAIGQARGPYDLVVLNLPDPQTAYLNRFYTREFLQSVADAIAPGGVVCLQVTSAANYLGESVASYGGSVFSTLRSVFPHVTLAVGDETRFFASRSPAASTEQLATIVERHRRLWPLGGPCSPQRLAPWFDPARIEFVRSALQAAAAPVNEDHRPVTYYLNMLLWSHFSGFGLASSFESLRRSGLPVFLAPLAVLFGVRLAFTRLAATASQAARFSATAAVAVTGFSAMAIQVVLVLLYQCLFGYLYERVGLLAALYMAGLAAGAAIATRWLPASGAAARPLGGLMAAQALFAAALPWLARHATAAEPVFGLLVAASGVLAGAALPFAVAARADAGDAPATAAGTLDAADHLGAAVGALAAGTLLVPLLGIEGTAVLLAAACAASAILLRTPGRTETAPRPRHSFPEPRLTWGLAAVVLAVFSYVTVLRLGRPGFSDALSGEALAATAGPQRYRRAEKPFPHYRGEDGAVVMASCPVDPGVRGYGGPMNLAVGLRADGRVAGARLLENNETPSYVAGMEGFLGRFTGRDSQRELPFTLDEIDGMTGATITSRAALELMNVSARRAGAEILGIRHHRPAGPAAPWWGGPAGLRAWGVAAVFALALLSHVSGVRRARALCLGLVLAALGLLWNVPFTLVDAGNLSAGLLPGLQEPARAVLVALVLASALALGPFFCGYLCPFGALQELLGLRTLQTRVRPELEQRARLTKYVLLAAAMCAFWLTDSAGWLSFEPMQTLFSGAAPRDVLALAVVVLALGTVYFRFWCRYLCPTGALLGLFNLLAFASRRARPRLLGRCDLGVSFEKDLECLRCYRCTWQTRPAGEERNATVEQVFVAGVLLSLVLAVAIAAERAGASKIPAGGARVIDAKRVREGLTRGELSNREALWYRRLPEKIR